MENFDFDVEVKVKWFNVTVTKGGTFVEQSSNSNMVTSNMKELFRSIGRGSVVPLRTSSCPCPARNVAHHETQSDLMMKAHAS